MYGKPHLDNNANTFACRRAHTDMQRIADDPSLPDLTRQLARQTRDLLIALHTSLEESSRGQSF